MVRPGCALLLLLGVLVSILVLISGGYVMLRGYVDHVYGDVAAILDGEEPDSLKVIDLVPYAIVATFFTTLAGANLLTILTLVVLLNYTDVALSRRREKHSEQPA